MIALLVSQKSVFVFQQSGYYSTYKLELEPLQMWVFNFSFSFLYTQIIILISGAEIWKSKLKNARKLSQDILL